MAGDCDVNRWLAALAEEGPEGEAALEALAALGPEAVELFFHHATGPGSRCRQRAREGLARLDKRDPGVVAAVIPWLRRPQRQLAIVVLEQVENIQDYPRAIPLLSALLFESGIGSTAAALIARIGGAEAVHPLVEGLRDPHLRPQCLEGLNRLAPAYSKELRTYPQLVPRLRGLLTAPALTGAAATTLVRIGTPDALAVLTDGLRGWMQVNRFVLLETLAGAGEPGAAALGHFLDTSPWASPLLRAEAVLALGSIGGTKAQERLYWLLGDPSPDVRGAAADALGRCGDSTCWNALFALLKDRDPGVRREAAHALAALRAEGGMPRQRTLIVLYQDDYRRFAAQGEAVIHLLGELLHDHDPAIRHRAAECLGLIGKRECLPALRARLRPLAERDVRVRTALRDAAVRIEAQTAATAGWPRASDARSPALEGRPRATPGMPEAGGRPRQEESIRE